MTRAQLEQALTDDVLLTAYNQACDGIPEDADMPTEALLMIMAATMRALIVTALSPILSVEPTPPQTWQPMSTAPKEYTSEIKPHYVLIAFPEYGVGPRFNFSVAAYFDGYWKAAPNDTDAFFQPTHWMPLPLPPAPAPAPPEGRTP